MASRGLKRLQKEFGDLQKKPVAGSTVATVNDDLYHWVLSLDGPAGTPYAGGVFKVDVKIPQEYPQKAPEVQFITKIYHPNIDEKGQACVQIITTNWAASVTLSRVITEVQNLLVNPDAEHASDPAIALEFTNDRATFNQKAAAMTAQYAH